MVKYKLCLILLFFYSLLGLAVAQAAQQGVVSEDEVNVYKSASFDSPVVTLVPKGTQLLMSDKLVGGAFYKVKVRDGLFGYISDVEIKPLKAKEEPPPVDTQKVKKGKKSTEATKVRKKKRKPFEGTRYVGPVVGSLNFNEDVFNDNQHATLMMYGVKFFGPDLLSEGPVWDCNITFSPTAPNYYYDVTKKSATGFLLISDALFLVPLDFASTHMIYLGLGPALVFSNFSITAGKTAFSLQQLRLGLAASAGFGVRVGSAAIRLEAKLYKEKYTYAGYYGSLQFEF